MTDEELKKKAEKTATKFMLLGKKLMDDETVGLTDDEASKFMFYFIAAYGAIGNQLNEIKPETEPEIDLHEYVDAMANAYEMVYENDQKPNWGA